MKVLFYNHTGMVSGAEHVLLTILTRLDRERYYPVVVCPAGSRMMELTTAAGVATQGLPQLEARFTWRPDRVAKYLWSFAKVIRRARKLVATEAPAFIHANSIRAGLVMSAATFGMRVAVIWHAHDILPRHPLSTAVRLFAALRRHNHILAVSNAVATRFHGTLLCSIRKRVPITVIHNAVDLSRFHPDEEAGALTRRRLNLEADQRLAGIIGQLTRRKGQLELIEAFAEVVRRMPNAVLLVVGSAIFNRDQDYAEELARTVDVLGIKGNVRFLGARDDVPDLIRALDVLVVNSHEEPFGLAVLEGLASGTATLATAVGGTPEMINHGANGWQVESGDKQALVDGLMTLFQNARLRQRLGRQGRLDAVARFSIDRFMGDIHSLYRNVIRGENPHLKNLAGLEVNLSAD